MANAEVDLRAQIVNVSVMRNDAWTMQVTIESPSGTPVNLTGRTITAQLRDRPDSTSSTALTVTPVDLTIGKFNVGQSAATAKGVYDVQITGGAVSPRTYIRGKLELTSDVTRP